MRFNKQVTKLFSIALATLILNVLCIQIVDIPFSALIARNLGIYAPHLKTTQIPDFLLITVVILTSISWIMYFYLVRQNIHNQRTLFYRVMGTVLPFSFCIKTILKWAFGRIETRTWLADQSLYGFHWFAGSEGFEGFPSGHMLVFTSMFLTFWHFYPRYRTVYGLGLFCLGIALIVAEYHFLGDVLAGVYIGTLVYLSTIRVVR